MSGMFLRVMMGVMIAVATASAEQVTYYVATDGNDAWSGTLKAPNAAKDDGPFATLARARDAIRQLKEEEGLPKAALPWWFAAARTSSTSRWNSPRRIPATRTRRSRTGPHRANRCDCSPAR